MSNMFDKTTFNVSETKTKIYDSKRYAITLTDESNKQDLDLKVGHSHLIISRDQMKDLFDIFKHYLVEKELLDE